MPYFRVSLSRQPLGKLNSRSISFDSICNQAELVSAASVATVAGAVVSTVDLVAGNGVLAVASRVHGSGGRSSGGGGTGLLTTGDQGTVFGLVSTTVVASISATDRLVGHLLSTVSTITAIGAGVDVGEEGEADADELRRERRNRKDKLGCPGSRGWLTTYQVLHG